MEYVNKAIDKYELATTKKKQSKTSRRTGCKGSYVLRLLPHHDRLLNTPVEPMHVLKNVVEHIVRLIVGAEDSRKVRDEEKQRGRFRKSWVRKGDSRLQPAPFRLTAAEASLANSRAMSIRVPYGFDWKPRAVFVQSIAMKSHSWKQLVSTFILKYCLRGLLGRQQRQSLFFFCNVLAQICAETVQLHQIDLLEEDMHRALSYLERDFPVSLHVCVFHLLHHVPFYIRRFGPPHGYWMYPFERFNSWVIKRVHNRRYPEATVVETYRLFEWAHYLQMSGHLPDNAIIHPGDTDVAEVRLTVCQLNTDQVGFLKQHYRSLMPQFNDLCLRYEGERRNARVRHKLRQFPAMPSWTPTSGPPLTTEEMEMRDMQHDILRMDRYTFRNMYGRTVLLSSREADSALSFSSYVLARLSDKLVFGRIEFFFHHTFCRSRNTLAYVCWFDHPQQDSESGLWYVDAKCESSLNPIVSVSNLSSPLVTATDCDRLWILSNVSF